MRRFLLLLIGLLAPSFAFAQYHLTDSGWSCSGFLGCTGGVPPDIVVFLVARIVALVFPTGGGYGFIFYLTIVVCFYGGFRMVASQGQEGKEAGKKALIYAASGFALAMLVSGILRFTCDYVYSLAGGTGGLICAYWWP